MDYFGRQPSEEKRYSCYFTLFLSDYFILLSPIHSFIESSPEILVNEALPILFIDIHSKGLRSLKETTSKMSKRTRICRRLSAQKASLVNDLECAMAI